MITMGMVPRGVISLPMWIFQVILRQLGLDFKWWLRAIDRYENTKTETLCAWYLKTTCLITIEWEPRHQMEIPCIYL